MVLKSLQQLPSFEDVTNSWIVEWKYLFGQLCGGDSGDSADTNDIMSRKRRIQEEHWTLEKDTQCDNDDDLQQQQHQQQQIQQQIQQITTLLHQIKTLTTNSLPSIISRILHTTPSILQEISQGYFVPFHTVALGCLGRIHTCINRLGRELVTVLQESVPQLRSVCQKKHNNDGECWKGLKDQIMSTFCIERRKDKTEEKKNELGTSSSSSSVSASSHEWNDLMTYYVGVSHDALLKQMNNYMKEKRWDDAMRRFGMGTSPLSKTLVSQGDGNDGDDGIDNEGDSAAHSSVDVHNDDNTANMSGDVGELVNMSSTHESTSHQNKSSDEIVDDNMARVKRLHSVSESSAVPKKKRRKRKKKKDGTTEAEPSKVNEQQQQQFTEEATKSDKSFDYSITNKPQEVDDDKLDQKEQSEDSKTNEPSDVAQPEDTHDHHTSENKQATKSKDKKANKKKKKTKKQPASVIDDIFGF